MATPRRDKDHQISSGFPLGLDNTSPESALPTNDAGIPVAVREALNVDFTKEGKYARRGGFVERYAGTGLHQSLFADPEFPYLMLRVGDALQAFGPDLIPETVVGALGETPVSYCLLNHELLWTAEGVRTGRLDSMLRDLPLGLPTPAGVAQLAAGGNGGLAAGTYQVALSHLDAHGEESGATWARAVTVAANGSIALALLAPPAGIEATRVWVSEANGTELYHYADASAGIDAVTIVAGERGTELRTQGLHPLPAGHLVRESNGIVWMALDNRVVYGEPMRPRLYDPGKNFIPYSARVDMIEPIGDGETAGVYVAAGKRVFYHQGGVPRTVDMRMVRLHGAVPGTSRVFPGEVFGPEYAMATVAYWMGRDGTPCLGLPGGTVKPLAKRAAMDLLEQGATLLRERNGMRQIITAGPRVGPVSTFAASDSAEVFQYRNGIAVP